VLVQAGLCATRRAPPASALIPDHGARELPVGGLLDAEIGGLNEGYEPVL